MSGNATAAAARRGGVPRLDLEAIEAGLVDGRTKGIAPGTAPLPLAEIGRRGWNLLRGDLALPAAVLRESALRHNGEWMRRFLECTGAVICPHGKTTMSPQLFQRQLEDGAWGITVADARQLRVCREHGVPRVLLANQLLGRGAIEYVLGELDRDEGFDFYCLVDSRATVEALARATRGRGGGEGGAGDGEGRRPGGGGRPVQVLVEAGLPREGRTGARDLDGLLAVAREVAAAPGLSLRGVEGFEGLVRGGTSGEEVARVEAFLDFIAGGARAVEREGLFGPGPVILSAGGSAWFDLVLERLGSVELERETLVVTRSGCYLTHDAHMYREAFERMRRRSERVRSLGPGLRPALEVWGWVQSRPSPQRAILGLGKRDCSFDAGLPVPLRWHRPAAADSAGRPEATGREPAEGGRERPGGPGPDGPRELGPGHEITGLNDQHAYLTLPAGSPLRVGDVVGCGISHPCTTFDRWEVVAVVDDAYDVVSAVRTFF